MTDEQQQAILDCGKLKIKLMALVPKPKRDEANELVEALIEARAIFAEYARNVRAGGRP